MEVNFVVDDVHLPEKRKDVGFMASRRLRRKLAPKVEDIVDAGLDESDPVEQETAKKTCKLEITKHAICLDSELFSNEEKSFQELGVHPDLCEELETKLSITRPTRIQSRCLGYLCNEAKDALINSSTGSGKTLCFILPLLTKLLSRSERVARSDGTLGMILVPTRELCLQIETVVNTLLQRFWWIVASSVMGGEKKKSEKARLRKGVTILIATPGRLLDHMQNTESLEVSNLEFLIIDEADRLMDLGFENSIFSIYQILQHKIAKPENVCCIMASATIAKKVDGLACTMLENPYFISAGEEKEHFDMPSGLEQGFVKVKEDLKFWSLVAFMKWKLKKQQQGKLKLIVFMMACKEVEFFHHIMHEVGIFKSSENFALHGKMTQIDRSETFKRFCSASSGILLATGIASRGLDLPQVDWIVQFDPPEDVSEYIHRVGRTARMGTTGRALLFLYENEMDFKRVLEDEQGLVMREIDGEALLKSPLAFESKEAWRELSMKVMKTVSENVELRDLARVAFLSLVRGYASFPKKLKAIFHVRSLHLGKLASSFFLKENPIQISNRSRRTHESTFKLPKRERNTKPKSLMNFKMNAMSEFQA